MSARRPPPLLLTQRVTAQWPILRVTYMALGCDVCRQAQLGDVPPVVDARLYEHPQLPSEQQRNTPRRLSAQGRRRCTLLLR